VDRAPDTLVRPAAADVAAERVVDVGVGRPGLLRQQRRRAHEHAGLAVAALRDESYRSPDGYVGKVGPSWLHRWRAGRGGDVQSALRREPDPPPWVMRLVQAGP